MAVEGLVTPLLRAPIFQGLPPLILARIARIAERIVYKPGDIIIRDGEPGDAAILLVSGEAVRIEAPVPEGGGELVAAGSLVGEMAMLVETEHSSTVVARSQVRALRIPATALNVLMEQDLTLAEHFIDKLTGRLSLLAAELRTIDAGLARPQFVRPALPAPDAAATATA